MSTNYKFYYLEVHIVDHCNLNCKGCFHYSPLADFKFYDLNKFKKELKQIISIAPINSFRLLGGEPLLHPQFLEFCKAARELLPEQHTWIGVLSNGLELKNWTQEQFDLFNSLNICFEFSNYFNDDNLTELVKSKFNNYKIEEHFKMNNLSLDFNSPNSAIGNFEHCSRAHCVTLRDGYLYRCSSDAWIDYLFKYFNFKPKEYNRVQNRLSIYKMTEESLNNWVNSPIQLCKYCESKNLVGVDTTFDWTTSKKDVSEWVYSLENTEPYKNK